MSKKPQKDEIKDEPGAEERFGKILGKVLHTPPKHKTADPDKAKSAAATSVARETVTALKGTPVE